MSLLHLMALIRNLIIIIITAAAYPTEAVLNIVKLIFTFSTNEILFQQMCAPHHTFLQYFLSFCRPRTTDNIFVNDKHLYSSVLRAPTR